MNRYTEKDELLLRCLQGKVDEQEYETAFNWVNSEKSRYDYYLRLRDAWIASGIVTRRDERDCNKAWQRISRRTGISLFRQPVINSGWRNIAAVFILSVAMGAIGYHFFYSYKLHSAEREYLVEAPLGSKTFIILPDNTEVWMNAGSILRYSTHYGFTGRSVYLSGEAYFKVEASAELPFRVHLPDLVVNAIGTEFNIKAYPEENVIETTLVSGLVSLVRTVTGGEQEKILLRPNQRASLVIGRPGIDVADSVNEDLVADIDSALEMPSRDQADIDVESVSNIDLYTSWKDKRMVFDREWMYDLAVKLERIYDVKITIMDEELKNYRITGSLEQETLEQLLYAIRLTIPLDFKIDKNNVVLTLNKSLKKKYNNI